MSADTRSNELDPRFNRLQSWMVRYDLLNRDAYVPTQDRRTYLATVWCVVIGCAGGILGVLLLMKSTEPFDLQLVFVGLAVCTVGYVLLCASLVRFMRWSGGAYTSREYKSRRRIRLLAICAVINFFPFLVGKIELHMFGTRYATIAIEVLGVPLLITLVVINLLATWHMPEPRALDLGALN